MQQFLEVFSELKGSNFFATGESVSVTDSLEDDPLILISCSMVAIVSRET